MSIVVAQEIHYLSNLTNVPCSQFRHVLITAKPIDPLTPPPSREAHIFTEENGTAHKAFDQAIRLIGARRKLDCMPEPGLPANLCYLSPTDRSDDFERIAAANGIGMAWGVLPVTKALLNYLPPVNITWIVTHIFARMMNPTTYLEAGAAEAGEQIGDLRSNDIDLNGYVTAWFNVKTTPQQAQGSIPASGLLNKPCLFAFQGKKRVRLFIQREVVPIASMPDADFRIILSLHGYHAPPEAFEQLNSFNTTTVEDHTAE